jgi:hypothetical protein
MRILRLGDHCGLLGKLNKNKVSAVRSPGTDVMNFITFLPKKSANNWRFTLKNKDNVFKNLIITFIFEKNFNFLRRKLSKIAKNCDHNIDPCSGKK